MKEHSLTSINPTQKIRELMKEAFGLEQEKATL